ncbi:hypothetical protein BDQ17DRAFT_1390390 [Cyathus striatus]|nr:hypothetical protein BDQ17DRAFT_1390390 [Cyathus striatus]
MNSEYSNAVAGPSNLHAPSPSSHFPATNATPFPSLFLLPPAPPLPKQHLESTQDLLGRFHLHDAYDKYVKSHYATSAAEYALDAANASSPGGSAMPVTPGGVDKGKGRELDATMHTPGPTGEKKKKNTYKHLIKGVPGKHSLKKDDFLSTIMVVPEKQRHKITPFDAKTQHDAFEVSLEGIKGWNINTLVLESAQAREDRKKRKELKRLAKAQQQAQQTQQQSGAPTAGSTPLAQPQLQAVPVQAPIPTPAAASQGNGIPRTAGNTRPSTPAGGGVGTPRPLSTVPRPGSTVPRPGSAVPRPGSTAPAQTPQSHGLPYKPVGTPLRTVTPTVNTAMDVDYRGKKRDRDDAPLSANGNGYGNGVMGNGNGYQQQQQAMNGAGMGMMNGSKTAVGAKAGVAGVRPRPIKKQRVDMQGQARDVNAPVQQQPTPTGA